MATEHAFRSVAIPFPGDEDPVAYSSIIPNGPKSGGHAEGDLITPPNTTVTDPCWLLLDYFKAAFGNTYGQQTQFIDGNNYVRRALLLVTYDTNDILEYVDTGLSTSSGTPGSPGYEEPVPTARFLVSTCQIGDELNYAEMHDLFYRANADAIFGAHSWT